LKLLESLPAFAKRGRTLAAIPGAVPAATRYPAGCRFADRCQNVMAVCASAVPPEVNVDAEHRVACHLYDSGHAGEILPSVVAEPAQPAVSVTPGPPVPLVAVSGMRVHFPIMRGLFKRTVGHVKAVDGADMTIPTGSVAALVGESGCGKTTFAKGLVRLVPLSGGTVAFGGSDMAVMSASALKACRRRIQMIFQDPYSSLNPRLTVREIVEEGLAVHDLAAAGSERERVVSEMLDTVGLDRDSGSKYPHEFSGGQRQRIGIARALAVRPSFVVCDEATSALDVSVQAQILNLLGKLRSEYDLTYLFITHDLGLVEYFADTVSVMYLGRVVEEGAVPEVFGSPRHPYTRALLAAAPRADGVTGRRRIELEGDVPSPASPPAGCHFHPRCPRVMPRCRTEYPCLSALSPAHGCRCHLYEEAG
jgi:peptide/nickel transport system ATP-binding protein